MSSAIVRFLDLPHPTSNEGAVDIPLDTKSVENPSSLIPVTELMGFTWPEFPDNVPRKPPHTLNQYDVTIFEYNKIIDFTFQVSQGENVLFGNVLRYLPLFEVASGQYISQSNVGRRSPRALVLLTTSPLMLRGVLCHIVVKRLQQKLEIAKFLEELVKAQPLPTLNVASLTLQVEVDECIYKLSREPMTLPLFRLLGVSPALHVLSALLSEHRVVIWASSNTSTSYTAGAGQQVQLITSVVEALLTLISYGGMSYPYLTVPILPNHKSKLEGLGYPGPYCIGVCCESPNVVENYCGPNTLLVNLDTASCQILKHDNSSITLQDWLQVEEKQKYDEATNTLVTRPITAVEILARELSSHLTQDKKYLTSSSSSSNAMVGSIQQDARIAQEQLKLGMKFLGSKLKKLGQKITETSSSAPTTIDSVDATTHNPNDSTSMNHSSNDSHHGSSYHTVPNSLALHSQCELLVQQSFISFFLYTFGNPRHHFIAGPNGLQADPKTFLLKKSEQFQGATGFLQFVRLLVNTRVYQKYVSDQQSFYTKNGNSISPEMVKFLMIVKKFSERRIDMGNFDYCRSVADEEMSSTARPNIGELDEIRRAIIHLTSNSSSQKMNNYEISTLINRIKKLDYCIDSILEVVEARLNDGKGLNWRHSDNSLYILYQLLIWAPLSSLPRLQSLLPLIRQCKYFTSNIPGSKTYVASIRSQADILYEKLIDFESLISKRNYSHFAPRLNLNRLESSLGLGRVRFKQLHEILKPSGMKVAPLPPPSAPIVGATATASVQRRNDCVVQASNSRNDHSNTPLSPTIVQVPPTPPPIKANYVPSSKELLTFSSDSTKQSSQGHPTTVTAFTGETKSTTVGELQNQFASYDPFIARSSTETPSSTITSTPTLIVASQHEHVSNQQNIGANPFSQTQPAPSYQQQQHSEPPKSSNFGIPQPTIVQVPVPTTSHLQSQQVAYTTGSNNNNNFIPNHQQHQQYQQQVQPTTTFLTPLVQQQNDLHNPFLHHHQQQQQSSVSKTRDHLSGFDPFA